MRSNNCFSKIIDVFLALYFFIIRMSVNVWMDIFMYGMV